MNLYESSPVTGRFSFTSVLDRWTWSDGMFTLHGMEPGEVVPTGVLFLRHVHPDDRSAVEQVIEASTSQVAGCEYRIVELDGKVRTVALTVSAEPDGTTTGHLLDVTATRNKAVAAGVNEQLALALESRAVIDQAKGVVMSTFGIDSETAFRCMVLISQHRNVRVRAVADKVIAAASLAGGADEDVLAQVSIALRTVAIATTASEETHVAGEGPQVTRTA